MLIRLIIVAGLVGSTMTAGLQQPPAKSAPKSVKAAARPPARPSAKTNAAKSDPSLPVAYVTTAEGNVARYRVRERLAGKELDNDAIGETPRVSGSITLDKTGKLVPGTSGFSAELALLKSDSDRRDGYVRRRLLVTDSFPTTTFKATEIRGLVSPLPTSGETTFQLVGDLTVKGVTRPSVWNVTATVIGDQLKGNASTRFTFKEFSLTQPRVPIVLSVADTIGLEYDFVMSKRR